MSLPFLKDRVVSAIVTKKLTHPLSAEQVKPMAEEVDPALIECAVDLVRAIDDRSFVEIAKALRSAFEVCDAAPHQEGPHIEMGED